MNIQFITESILKDFIEQEQITRSMFDIFTEDSIYIESTEDMQSMVNRYGIYNYHNQLVGFCITPIYEPTILQRIYISILHRRMGYADYAIKTLSINSLGCLKNNYPALNLYKKLGFVEENNINHHYNILKLRITP